MQGCCHRFAFPVLSRSELCRKLHGLRVWGDGRGADGRQIWGFFLVFFKTVGTILMLCLCQQLEIRKCWTNPKGKLGAGTPPHGKERSDLLLPQLWGQPASLNRSTLQCTSTRMLPQRLPSLSRLCISQSLLELKSLLLPCGHHPSPPFPPRLLPHGFLLLLPWVEVLQHLLGLSLLSFCLFATGEGHGQELVVQPGRRMPAEHSGTASAFSPHNKGNEHLQLWRGPTSERSPIPIPTARPPPKSPVPTRIPMAGADPAGTMAWLGVWPPRQATPASPAKALFTLLLPGCSSSQNQRKTALGQCP